MMRGSERRRVTAKKKVLTGVARGGGYSRCRSWENVLEGLATRGEWIKKKVIKKWTIQVGGTLCCEKTKWGMGEHGG